MSSSSPLSSLATTNLPSSSSSPSTTNTAVTTTTALGGSSSYSFLLLDQVKRDAALAWPQLTVIQRLDKTFILAAIQYSPTLPSKSDFERSFPQSLRFDRNIVLSFAKRIDFVQLFHERHLFVPECCTDDVEIMLEYCRKIPRSLQDVKWDGIPNKKDVRDLIRAAIMLDGMELQYVPLEYQEEFFELAILQNGKAVRLCPNAALMEKVSANRDIMLKVVASCGPMLKRASLVLQQDEEIVLAAVCQGGLEYKSIPKMFQTNPTFLEQAISERASLYLQLSSRPTLQGNLALCLAAVLSRTSNPEVQIAALSHQKQAIWQNRNAVLAMALYGDLEKFSDTLGEMLNNNNNNNAIHLSMALAYSRDMEIMRAAVARNGKLLFTLAAENLRTEVDLILSSIQPDTAWNTLRSIPQSSQLQHPEITLKAIQVSSPKHLHALTNHIPEALWRSHRPLIQAWIRRGAPVLLVFTNLISNDRELALELAKYNWQEFRVVNSTLLSDREFMLEAVQRDGRVLQYASSTLKQDFSLAVYAVANRYDTLRCMAHTTVTLHHHGRPFRTTTAAAGTTTSAGGGGGGGGSSSSSSSSNNWITAFRQHVTTQLELYHIFVTEFLRGICCTTLHHHHANHTNNNHNNTADDTSSRKMPRPAKRCPLQLLDRGTETTQAWKRLIALYLGVPLGIELRMLRTCQTYLEQYEQQPSLSTAASEPSTRAMAAAAHHPLHHHHHNRNPRLANAHRVTAAERAMIRFRLAHHAAEGGDDAVAARPMWARLAAAAAVDHEDDFVDVDVDDNDDDDDDILFHHHHQAHRVDEAAAVAAAAVADARRARARLAHHHREQMQQPQQQQQQNPLVDQNANNINMADEMALALDLDVPDHDVVDEVVVVQPNRMIVDRNNNDNDHPEEAEGMHRAFRMAERVMLLDAHNLMMEEEEDLFMMEVVNAPFAAAARAFPRRADDDDEDVLDEDEHNLINEAIIMEEEYDDEEERMLLDEWRNQLNE